MQLKLEGQSLLCWRNQDQLNFQFYMDADRLNKPKHQVDDEMY